METIKIWYIGNDRATVSGLIESVANNRGFTLDTFSSFDEGFARMPTDNPDVLLIDHTSCEGDSPPDPDEINSCCDGKNLAVVFLYREDDIKAAVDAITAGYDLCWDALGVESELFESVLIREVVKKRELAAARADSPGKRPGSALLNETVASLVEGSVELLALKEDLEKRNRELELVRDELEQFVHTVSHDLKEPLMTVRTFTQKLSEGLTNLKGDSTEHLNMVMHSVVRMTKQIDGLLAFSRAGRIKPDMVVESVKNVIREIETNRGYNKRQDIEILIRSTLPSLKAHHEQVRQIFGNLISNGIKYNRRDRKVIEIGTAAAPPEKIRGKFAANEESDKFTLFYVSDNGIGIDCNNREAPFELFRRLNDDEEFEGDGAGLAIVKRAVLSLGGAIDFTSDPDKGTVMYFTLPHTTKAARHTSAARQKEQKRSVAELRAALFR